MYSPLNESDLVLEFDNLPPTSENQSTPRTCPLPAEVATDLVRAPARSWKPRRYQLTFRALRRGSLVPILDEDHPEMGRRPQTPDGLCCSPSSTPRGQLAFIESTSPDKAAGNIMRCPSLPNLWTGQPDTPEWDDATPSWVAKATSAATSPAASDAHTAKSLNMTTSSGPICRICHEGEQFECLRSLCRCSGTVGLVHVACLERWLSSSSTFSCELCQYRFPVVRNRRSLAEWIRTPDRGTRRALLSDIFCFILLTPIALVSCLFIAKSATKQILEGRALEASCLLVLGSVLLTAYSFWVFLALRFHRNMFLEWQMKNLRLSIDVRDRTEPRHNSEELADIAALGASVEYLHPEAAAMAGTFPPF